MPGSVRGTAARGASGPIYATSADGDDPFATVLTAVDVAGDVLWRREIGHGSDRPCVGPDGTVWAARREADEAGLIGLDAAGTLLHSLRLEHEPHEHLGAFAMLPDGFVVSWLPAGFSRIVEPGRHARVARHDADGRRRWSTPAVLDDLAHPGVVELGARTGGRVRESRPWKPRTIEAHHWEPLLVSGDRVAATFADGGSGIAVAFFLDTATGRLVAATPPGPLARKAIAGPGEFIIGSQGYGTAATTRYDASGRSVRSWPTHAMLLIDERGDVRGPESENVLPSRSRFVGLAPDGAGVRQGPPLSGYYTTYPALDEYGTAVFWRDGGLHAVTSDYEMRTLHESAGAERGVWGRTLLMEEGRSVIHVRDELWTFTGTGLGALAKAPWPCADGGLAGNPVAHL